MDNPANTVSLWDDDDGTSAETVAEHAVTTEIDTRRNTAGSPLRVDGLLVIARRNVERYGAELHALGEKTGGRIVKKKRGPGTIRRIAR